MQVLQQILIWFFGILAGFFLIMSLISIFSFGSSLFWVPEKANEKSHFYLLFAAISSTLWLITYSPNSIFEAMFCMLPISIIFVWLSYSKRQIGKKFFEQYKKRTGIDYPFKDHRD